MALWNTSRFIDLRLFLRGPEQGRDGRESGQSWAYVARIFVIAEPTFTKRPLSARRRSLGAFVSLHVGYIAGCNVLYGRSPQKSRTNRNLYYDPSVTMHTPATHATTPSALLEQSTPSPSKLHPPQSTYQLPFPSQSDQYEDNFRGLTIQIRQGVNASKKAVQTHAALSSHGTGPASRNRNARSFEIGSDELCFKNGS